MSPSVCMSVPVSISRSHMFFLRIRFSLAECQCSASYPQPRRGAWSGGSVSNPQCVWKRRAKTTERRSHPGSYSGYLPFTGEESVGLALTAQRWDIYPSPPHRRAFLRIPLVVVDWEGARSGLKKSRLSPGMVEVGWGWFGGEKVVPGPLDRVPRGPLPAAWRLGGTITSGVTRRVVGTGDALTDDTWWWSALGVGGRGLLPDCLVISVVICLCEEQLVLLEIF